MNPHDLIFTNLRELHKTIPDTNVPYERIMKARQMLADDHLLAQEVAIAVGYKDYSNFYRAFKRIIGVSPSKFRTRT